MIVRPVAVMMTIALLAAGAAMSQTEWNQYPGNPVIPAPAPGAWDAGNRNPLAVVFFDGTYHLYFNGQAEGSPAFLYYDIGHAWSTNGVDWTVDPDPVLTRGAQGEWDDTSLWGAAVIHDGSLFKMWYCGLHDGIKRAGYAWSDDGTDWHKYYEHNPVMDVRPGFFDEREVKPGAVVLRGGLYQMWYTGATVWNAPPYDWRIGYAESNDGITWLRRSEPVLVPGLPWEGYFLYGPSVLFDGATYHIWYTGGGYGSRDIGYAVSPDGIVWTKCAGNPVIDSPPGEKYDFPNVLVDDEELFWMWYHAVVSEDIRLATSDCCGVMIFADSFNSGDTSAWSATLP